MLTYDFDSKTHEQKKIHFHYLRCNQFCIDEMTVVPMVCVTFHRVYDPVEIEFVQLIVWLQRKHSLNKIYLFNKKLNRFD